MSSPEVARKSFFLSEVREGSSLKKDEKSSNYLQPCFRLAWVGVCFLAKVWIRIRFGGSFEQVMISDD